MLLTTWHPSTVHAVVALCSWLAALWTWRRERS